MSIPETKGNNPPPVLVVETSFSEPMTTETMLAIIPAIRRTCKELNLSPSVYIHGPGAKSDFVYHGKSAILEPDSPEPKPQTGEVV